MHLGRMVTSMPAILNGQDILQRSGDVNGDDDDQPHHFTVTNLPEQLNSRASVQAHNHTPSCNATLLDHHGNTTLLQGC